MSIEPLIKRSIKDLLETSHYLEEGLIVPLKMWIIGSSILLLIFAGSVDLESKS